MSNFNDYWNNLAISTNSRFEQVGYPDSTQSVVTSIIDEMLYYVSNIERDSKILEIGCGNGLLLEELSSRGFTNLYGCDYSAKMIDNARNYCSEVRFEHSEANKISEIFPLEEFDFIFVHSVIQYFDNEEYFYEFLRGSLKALRVGGCIFIGDAFNPYVRDYYSAQQSTNILSWIKKRFGPNKGRVLNYYLDLTSSSKLNECLDGYRVYPLLEWLNKKPLMFKALRYNILIQPR